MTAQDEAYFICDEINEIRYKYDEWESLSIIKSYYIKLDEIGYMYVKEDYDVIDYNDDETEDFYVNDDYLDDDEK